MLEDLFIIKIVYLKENNSVIFRREKKIFFRDPFIYKTFSLITNKEMRRDVLYEHIVQEHLYRKFGEIFYYRNKYEIDCVAGDMKIEVKAGKPHRRYPRGVTVLEEKDLPWFLLSLNL
jgi:predicted AAA+ superfamily ATPase